MQDWFTRPVTDRLSGIRDSWLKDVTCDYKVFKGKPCSRIEPLPDEVFLDASDDYHHSFEKIRALISYALDGGYDYLLKVDDDVYVYWDRILKNIPTADYVGGPVGTDYCSGMTYWLSKHAMEFLRSAPTGNWAEDRWVGESLRRKGINCSFDGRYHIAHQSKTNQYISDEELAKPNEYLSVHSLSPDQMRGYYASRSSGHPGILQ